MAVTTVPMATAAAFTTFGSFGSLVTGSSTDDIDRLMVRSTRAIERRCDRRLVSFTVTESTRAQGIDPDSAGTSHMPIDMQGALGMSKARALGVTDMVRDLWVQQYPPVEQDMWAYSGVSASVQSAYGGLSAVRIAEGPEPDTGHLRLPLGTFCPVGSTVRITYSGGYFTIPEDLELATIYQAAKFSIVGAEPQERKEMSTVELDHELTTLLAPYMRF